MVGSLILYSGIVIVFVGAVLAIWPMQRIGLGRSTALVIAGIGVPLELVIPDAVSVA